jgi:hypothetical protein
MKISHVNFGGPINFIEVREYSNSIVNVYQSSKPTNSEFCNGVWKVKQLVAIPNEYKSNYEFIKK